MQRKMLGFILQRIYWAQDYLSITAYADRQGCISSEKKKRAYRINEMMIPWIRALSTIMKHDSLNKITEAQKALKPNGVTVYARVNIQNNSMYIGETQDFQARFTQHYMNTFKHSDRCKKQCRGCKEHTKYRKHRTVSPHQWIMIPIYSCQEKYEAKRMERKLIKLWKPKP